MDGPGSSSNRIILVQIKVVAWENYATILLKLKNMDENLTLKIQEYINAEPSERDIESGALLLLKLNRNRILYNNIIRKPLRFTDKLLYELKKHLAIRLDQKTIEDVVLMEKTLLPKTAKLIAKAVPAPTKEDPKATIAKGKRKDHDSLPEEIQQLWTDCAGIFKNIKLLHENLKKMGKSAPCDRYELLKQLDEQDTLYRQKMADYDHFKIGTKLSEPKGDKTEEQTPAEVAKKVNAARTYLSKNKDKLKQLLAEKSDKYPELRDKMQERYSFLIESGNQVDDEQKNELATGGLTV